MTSDADGVPRATGGEAPKTESAGASSSPRVGESLASLTLGSMRAVALFTALGALFARAAAPALHGVAVGYDRFTNRAQSVAEVVSQLVAVLLLTSGLALAVEVARSRAPIYLRALSIVLTGSVSFLLFASIQGERPFTPVLVALSISASTLAIASGVDAVKQPASGLLGAVAVLSGVSSTTRALSVILANRAALMPRSEGVEWSRVVATVSFGAQVVMLVVAAGWITTRSKKLVSPVVLAALALAALGTRQALVETRDPGPIYFFVKHCAGSLLSRPVPFAPLAVEIFVAIFGPMLAIAVLAQRNQVPALLASLSLLLLAGASAEIPLYAGAIVVASLAMTLSARDARGVWAAIAAAERTRKR